MPNDPAGPSTFLSNVPSAVLEQLSDPIAKRLFTEYGSMFVSRSGVIVPERIIFRDEDDVSSFQEKCLIGSIRFGDVTIELQAAAVERLRRAAEQASEAGLSITPRSADSGRRVYSDTVELWHSRVEPALLHWVREGRLEPDRAEHIRCLSPFDQVAEIFELEARGMFFAKDLSKSIIYSVAPPGTSQHLSMLAFDVREFDQPEVRQILADHFWYQTVTSDLPHFTYLGASEPKLPSLGLKRLLNQGRAFYVPDI
jgi:hypothetical protein